MNEDKYFVKDINGCTVAEKMSLESAMLLCEAMFNKYYNEDIQITIGKMPKTKAGDDTDHIAANPVDGVIVNPLPYKPGINKIQ